MCKETETIKHLFYDCRPMKDMWKKISDSLKVDLSWEKIILGFTDDLTVHRYRNLVITIVLYARHKYWLKSLDEHVDPNLFIHIVKNDMSSWKEIVKKLKFDKNHYLMKNLWNQNIFE